MYQLKACNGIFLYHSSHKEHQLYFLKMNKHFNEFIKFESKFNLGS